MLQGRLEEWTSMAGKHPPLGITYLGFDNEQQEKEVRWILFRRARRSSTV